MARVTPDEFLREYEAANRSHDLERVLRLVHDDAVYWFSDGKSHCGRAAIARAIRSNFDTIEAEDYRIEDVAWLARDGDFPACTYRFVWSGVIGGTPASGAGRGTCVLARRADSWAVLHEHLSQGVV
ncbi:MAG: nuclear transport factor 2 family protein [Deltaproteobacteria bacterium]|nr:nuclear transport factor 2 family protein [Deltaproteobacteria bacterium]MBW2415420.1 nuclear transport factor 2 family protein [Deltaproteobacteria bacterium]